MTVQGTKSLALRALHGGRARKKKKKEPLLVCFTTSRQPLPTTNINLPSSLSPSFSFFLPFLIPLAFIIASRFSLRLRLPQLSHPLLHRPFSRAKMAEKRLEQAEEHYFQSYNHHG
ncbi:hypothetical protein B9Z19DRAFT_626430 [Tuber borchii]|uniref:Uncharacterized protein n=1 Tax=Tuber borchii TaxID=42251 RepID=A0A2T7A0M6_TUBBO|nr:hypothetical protein B9Z19DRAFT_626430 [Tuber borchii]